MHVAFRRLKDNHAETPISLKEQDLQLPNIDVQMHLLEVFFDFTHSAFPILDKRHFMKEFQSRFDMRFQVISALTREHAE